MYLHCKLSPVLAKHYSQKTTFLCSGEQLPREGVKTTSCPGQLVAVLENAGWSWSDLRLPPLTYDQRCTRMHQCYLPTNSVS